MDQSLASLVARSVSDRSCHLMYAACLAHEAAFALQTDRSDAEDTLALLQHFWMHRVVPSNQDRDGDYLSLIQKISARC
jgi:hypothetical protein